MSAQLPDPELHTIPPDRGSMDNQPVWRHDFPIDWPQDHYVARRDFTKFLVLTSFAFVVGQVWIGIQNFLRRRRGEPPIVKVAEVSDLVVGQALPFSYPGEDQPCLLLRLADDRFVAFGQKCTHLACAVVPEFKANHLLCPCHKGYFDLETGRPIAGPPRRPLPRILLQVSGDAVYATGVELRTT
jgi:Rieske Fe-S protein